MASGGTDYGTLLKRAFELMIKGENIVILLVGMVVVVVASMFTFGIAAGPFLLGYTSACMKMARGEQVAMDELWTGLQRLVPAIVTSLILGIAVMVGFVLCVVPGVVVLILGSFTFNVMVDDPNLSGMDAIKKSAELVKANVGDVIIVSLIVGVIASVGSVIVVGSIIAMPFGMLASALLFDEIKKRSGGGDASGNRL